MQLLDLVGFEDVIYVACSVSFLRCSRIRCPIIVDNKLVQEKGQL